MTIGKGAAGIATIGLIALTGFQGGGLHTESTNTKAGWIGSVSASYAQQTAASIHLPSSFARANLLVAVVANDGPDSNSQDTHAVFGGEKLSWVRRAHISARQDWAVPPATIDLAGASSAEIWTAAPPRGWSPGTVTEISNHPESASSVRDDGGVITIAAWSSGKLGQIATVDGLASRPESQSFDTLMPGTVVAAVFNGRANASFTPNGGYQTLAARRAGDDSAQIIVSTAKNLPAGIDQVGYLPTPSPGNYWEMAIAQVVPS
jgi:hypothetical protein